LAFASIYQRDNDYGNDKAAQRLICWKVAVGSAIAEINMAKELLRTDVVRCKVSTKGTRKHERLYSPCEGQHVLA
jgi:hypothetical protein